MTTTEKKREEGVFNWLQKGLLIHANGHSEAAVTCTDFGQIQIFYVEDTDRFKDGTLVRYKVYNHDSPSGAVSVKHARVIATEHCPYATHKDYFGAHALLFGVYPHPYKNHYMRKITIQLIGNDHYRMLLARKRQRTKKLKEIVKLKKSGKAPKRREE